MFLRLGKNKVYEGSLFQCLLAMAATATTAMFFSPISDINWQFGFILMGAAAAVVALFMLIEARRLGRASLRRGLTTDPLWGYRNPDPSVESTYAVTKPEQRQGTMQPSVDCDEA
jgi:hypothetical protein